MSATGGIGLKKPARVSQATAIKRLMQAWQDGLAEALAITPAHLEPSAPSQLGPDDDESPEALDRLFASTIHSNLSAVPRKVLRDWARGIRTEEDLRRELAKVRRVTEEVPALFRKKMKALWRKLPRRGGPGRKRKLSPVEATIACNHIAESVRRGASATAALQRLAATSVEVLGKKVGTRTLQKAWKERGTH